jgi:hypothetical protein
MRPKSSVPTLREIALSVIDNAAAALQKADPKMSLPQALAKAVRTDDEARSAWRVFQNPAAALPLAEALAALSAGQAPAPVSMRSQIIQKRAQVSKEGAGGGSGARGGRVEDPKTPGSAVSPADSLPNPSDSIYAQIRADAIAANPTLSAQQAVSAYLTTSQGQAAHARFAAARQQEGQ